MGKFRDPEKPFKMISIDYVGSKTRTSRGNCYTVVAIDNFSKFIIMKPLRAATAEATIEFLLTDVFYKYGVPAIIISDNGRQLTSNEFAQFLAKYNVEHWKIPNYHPQANATEAANKTIMTAVRAYVRDDRTQRFWDTHLPALACALNSAIHTTTKFSPYKILYGFDMITDGQLHLPVEKLPTIREPSHDHTLTTIRRRVAENLRIAYEEYKKNMMPRQSTIWNTPLARPYGKRIRDSRMRPNITRRNWTTNSHSVK